MTTDTVWTVLIEAADQTATARQAVHGQTSAGPGRGLGRLGAALPERSYRGESVNGGAPTDGSL